MSVWGRQYYNATQGGKGDSGHHVREFGIIKTPADYQAMGRAQEKRIRKARKTLRDNDAVRQTIQPKLVALA